MTDKVENTYMMWVEGKEVQGGAEQSVSEPLIRDLFDC